MNKFINNFGESLGRTLIVFALAFLTAIPLGYIYAQSVALRVGQLVYNPGNRTIYLVGQNALYGFPDAETFYSWGFSFSQILAENSSEQSLSMAGIVPAKLAGCNAPLDQINNNCGGLVSGTPRAGQLVYNPGSRTIYLVGQNALYGFPDAATFYSWGFVFSQVVPVNSTEAALTMSGLVPVKQVGCNAPLDQIAGTCSITGASINVTIPVGGEQWAVGSSHNVTWSAPASVANVSITLSPYIACLYSNPRCMIAQIKPYTIASNVSNTGNFSWNIGTVDAEGRTFYAGQYMLTVSSIDGSVSGTTAAPFTITAVAASTAAPAISSLNPVSGQVGTQVTISGSGFTSTGNTIQFDVYSFTNVSSTNNGATLAFYVPAALYYNNCPVGTMCPNMARITTKGNYGVSVGNSNGTSNTQTFIVTGSPGP